MDDPAPVPPAVPGNPALLPVTGDAATGAGAAATPAPVALTPEEQMAAFERELKETDWGHQPC